MNRSEANQKDEDYTLGPNTLDLLGRTAIKGYNAIEQTDLRYLILEARNLDNESHEEKLDYAKALMPIEFPVIGDPSLFHRFTYDFLI
ncbi:hypothetical protein J4217_00340 [Candidatus Pacearchaeota archaeon]|nr:hypothetical protein [Candidatus Pacearchaeota archaeon]